MKKEQRSRGVMSFERSSLLGEIETLADGDTVRDWCKNPAELCGHLTTRLEKIEKVCKKWRRLTREEAGIGIQREVQALLREKHYGLGKFGVFKSPHEAYAVILEELDEAWKEIKHGTTAKSVQEMLQVSALSLRYVEEFGDGTWLIARDKQEVQNGDR